MQRLEQNDYDCSAHEGIVLGYAMCYAFLSRFLHSKNHLRSETEKILALLSRQADMMYLPSGDQHKS
jgi:hypothetical protein